MRRLWLKNPRTGQVWDLSSDYPYAETGGCPISSLDGTGYEAEIKTYDVMHSRFVEEIKRKAPPVKFNMHFKNQRHFDEFAEFVGDFTSEFDLCYSANGGIKPEQAFERPWYKKVVIQDIGKGAKQLTGWYKVSVTLYSLSIWRRDNCISVVLKAPDAATALIMPYVYPFHYDGSKWIAQMRNNGLTTPLRIELTNVGSNPEWTVTDATGAYQRARFNVHVGSGETLIVDSNPEVQRAEVISSEYSVSSQVYNMQEPDVDFINFVTLPNGKNTVAVNIGNNAGAEIRITYNEQRDVM